MALSVRRVVTGHNGDGQAVVVSDERLQPLARPGRPGVTSCELWSTDAMPVDLSDEAAAAQRGGFVKRYNYVGTGEGTVIRLTQFEPGGLKFHHRTETLDYAILLSGACDLELDRGETVHLGAGDVVVQRGTIHAWVNPGPDPCVFVFVLIDATPPVVGGQELLTHYPVA